jgi:hypothetical protein
MLQHLRAEPATAPAPVPGHHGWGSTSVACECLGPGALLLLTCLNLRAFEASFLPSFGLVGRGVASLSTALAAPTDGVGRRGTGRVVVAARKLLGRLYVDGVRRVS